MSRDFSRLASLPLSNFLIGPVGIGVEVALVAAGVEVVTGRMGSGAAEGRIGSLAGASALAGLVAGLMLLLAFLPPCFS